MALPLKDFNLIMVTENPTNKMTFKWSIRDINKISETIRSSKFSLAPGKPLDWDVSILYDKKDDMLLVKLAYHGLEDAPPIAVGSRSRVFQSEGSVLAEDQEYAHVFHGGNEHTLYYLIKELGSCDKKLVFQSAMAVHGYDVACTRQLFNDDGGREMEKLGNEYSYMFRYSDFADVDIEVEGKRYSAHKCVLKYLAPKLFREHQEDILKGKCSLDVVGNRNIFDVVLRSIYDWKPADQHVIDQCWNLFYPVAVKYELKRLLKACRKEMVNAMTVDRVFEFYEMANKINDHEMVKYCKGFVKDNVPDWESVVRYRDMVKINQ